MTTLAQNKTITLQIARSAADDSGTAAFASYSVELTQDKTVLDALLEIKSQQDPTLTFRYSCMHSICGSCAMQINDVNQLACATPLGEHVDATGTIVIRPLAHQPVIRDLVVDMTHFWNQYTDVKPWLIAPPVLPEKEFRVSPEEVSGFELAETCILCGVCFAACPVAAYGTPFSGPHALLKAFLRANDSRDTAPDEHISGIENIWACTTCLRCVSQCPKSLAPGEAVIPLRGNLVEDGKLPRTAGTALTSMFRNKNPFEMPHEDRTAWTGDLEMGDATDSAETLLFTCCMNCYDPRAGESARSLLHVLQTAGLSMTSLGEKESCCGSEARRLGEQGLFEMIVEEQSELLRTSGAKQIVTTSPHCYDAYRNYYPDLATPVMHYTQILAGLIQDGHLKPTQKIQQRVTYHDPCYLGIQNSVYDAPRTILNSIPGLELVEMVHYGSNSLCCGGGGGNMWLESGSELSRARILEAQETGANIIASACPFCLNMLDSTIKASGLEEVLVVKDVAELLAESLMLPTS